MLLVVWDPQVVQGLLGRQVVLGALEEMAIQVELEWQVSQVGLDSPVLQELKVSLDGQVMLAVLVWLDQLVTQDFKVVQDRWVLLDYLVELVLRGLLEVQVQLDQLD